MRRSGPVRAGRAVLFAGLVLVALPPALDLGNGYLKPATGCRVVAVTDGDTVRLACPGAAAERARLIGFDAPEIFSPGCFTERAKGFAAMFALRWRLWTAARIETRGTGRDRYGRRLVTLILDGEDVAAPMVASGLARVYHGGKREGWCA